MVAETVTAAIGRSMLLDATLAGREAAMAALERLGEQPPQLAIVLASSWFDQPMLLQGIRSIIGELPLIGQSTAMEIGPDGPITHSCSIVLFSSAGPGCGIGIGYEADAQPRIAGQRAAFAALKGLQSKIRSGFLLFGDGLRASARESLLGIQEVLGTSFPVAGSLSGDEMTQDPVQYCGNDICSRSVTGALFGGVMRIGIGNEHGFSPISKPRSITGARGNVLLTIDGQPAASVYQEYFGAEMVARLREEGRSRQSIAYPFGVQSASSNQWLLRNVVSIGTDGSLACTGEIAEGGWLQLMIGSRELALDAARRAAQQAILRVNNVAAALVFDSMARRTLLGAHTAALEIGAIREVLGPSVPIAGCYTYAEEAPFVVPASPTEPEGMQVMTQTGSVLVVAVGS